MIIYDKLLADKITSMSIANLIHFFALSYDVSDETVNVYIKIYEKYPLVYKKDDHENEIKKKLIGIERILKIKKLRCTMN